MDSEICQVAIDLPRGAQDQSVNQILEAIGNLKITLVVDQVPRGLYTLQKTTTTQQPQPAMAENRTPQQLEPKQQPNQDLTPNQQDISGSLLRTSTSLLPPPRRNKKFRFPRKTIPDHQLPREPLRQIQPQESNLYPRTHNQMVPQEKTTPPPVEIEENPLSRNATTKPITIPATKMNGQLSPQDEAYRKRRSKVYRRKPVSQKEIEAARKEVIRKTQNLISCEDEELQPLLDPAAPLAGKDPDPLLKGAMPLTEDQTDKREDFNGYNNPPDSWTQLST